MNRFPTEWLRLREPFDHAARSTALIETLLDILPASRPLRILELAAGLGSGMRFLAPLLPTPQHWTMIDHDPALLASIGQPPTNKITLETLEFDLRELDKLSFSTDLVSTQALLDLVSDDWLESLVNRLADQSIPILAALTVDGRVRWSPEDPRDAEIQQAFRAHQTSDRGFGPSVGTQAILELERLLSARNYTIIRKQADWSIAPAFARILKELVDGTAEAAMEACSNITTTKTVTDWHRRRRSAIASGDLSLQVGHLDLLALPSN